MSKTKTYKVLITYTCNEKESEQSMSVEVDGKQAPIPKGLENWIARDYLNHLLWEDKTKITKGENPCQ